MTRATRPVGAGSAGGRWTTAVAGLLLAGSLVLGPDALRAQSPGTTGAPPPAQADTVELVFEREIFNYPAYPRRNPFTPLTGDESGPRFEQLRLMAVLNSPTPGQSIALLSTGTGEGARSYRVREGQVLGNVRIIRIGERQIVVEVDEFGIRENRVLELSRPGSAEDLPDRPPEDDVIPPPDGAGSDTGADPDSAGAAGGAAGIPDSTGTAATNGTGGLE